MLKPDSSLERQLADTGPMLLWRDRAGGGREGLALTVHACANPRCPCRDAAVDGWLVGGDLIGLSCNDEKISFVVPTGAQPERKVLWASVDVDDGSVGAIEGAARSEPWAIEWLRGALDKELLGNLRQRFLAAKHDQGKRPPYDWRKGDWSHWKPGMDVGWRDIHEDDEDDGEVILDGKTYVVGDYYCVEPGCECEEVRLIVWLEPAPGAEFEDVGEVWVNPTMPSAAQFHAHGRAHPLLKRLWTAWSERRPVAALLLQRQKELRGLAPEIHRLFGKVAKPTVGPNERCPCGSGKKFKRCCGGSK